MIVLLLLAPLAEAGEVRATLDTMGTRFTIVIPDADPEAVRRDLDAAFAEIRRVDEVMSEWRPESPLSAVNANAGGEAVPIPEDLVTVLGLSLDVARASGGAFDPTWAALRGLWRFDGTGTVPSRAEVAERVRRVDWHDLIVDPEAATARLRREGMAVGLGGIAKGWALDRAADALRSRGHEDFLLDAGGQVYAAGHPEPGRDWVIGLRDPRGAPDDWFATVEVSDASVATSGDYEHFFVQDGVRYHHIVDPDTGWPARGLRSVTVIASDATSADSWDTAMFVLGLRRGLALAERQHVQTVIVDDAGTLYATPGSRLDLRHPPLP